MLEPNKIYCGDCLELMKEIPDGSVDCVITDPPYGIAWDTNYSRFLRGTSDKKSVYGDEYKFNPIDWMIFDTVVLWGANHYSNMLPATGTWLIWDKRNADGTAFLADGEIGWVNKNNGVKIFTQSGQQHRATSGGYHPTQKPVNLMMWCIENFTSPGDLILDPFLGSGTTAVAALKTGRRFIGIEIDETYYAIARKRVDAELAQLKLDF